jgi:hypothetical protein
MQKEVYEFGRCFNKELDYPGICFPKSGILLKSYKALLFTKQNDTKNFIYGACLFTKTNCISNC